MKKFALLTIGFTKPSPEMMEQWMSWFKSLEGKIVQQVGLRNGKKVTLEGTTDLAMDAEAITGYLIINAESIEEAEEIAKKCPMITATNVYEVAEH